MGPHVPVAGYEHTGVFFRDTEAASLWYRSYFGAVEVSRSNDKMPIIFLSFGRSSLLEMVPAGESDPVKPSDHFHISFGVEDLNEAVENLEKHGVGLVKPVFEAYEGSPVAFIRDLEGNLVQLVERKSSLPVSWR